MTADTNEAKALAALRAARMFIRNGVALGYIRMPDADTPDTAHNTLPLIESAIAALAQQAGAAPQAQMQHMVYAWLGRWRDTMPSEAVTALQNVLGPLDVAAPHAQPSVEWVPMVGKCQACGHEHEVRADIAAAPALPESAPEGLIEAMALAHEQSPCHDLIGPMEDAYVALRRFLASQPAAPARPQEMPEPHLLFRLSQPVDEALKLEQIDAAFETEIARVSHVHYDSNEICRHFFGELRKRLAALSRKGQE